MLHKFFSMALQSELALSCSMFNDAFSTPNVDVSQNFKKYYNIQITNLFPINFLKSSKDEVIVDF